MAVIFETDDELARRLRAIEAKLRNRNLSDLADEVADVAQILDPEAIVQLPKRESPR